MKYLNWYMLDWSGGSGATVYFTRKSTVRVLAINYDSWFMNRNVKTMYTENLILMGVSDYDSSHNNDDIKRNYISRIHLRVKHFLLRNFISGKVLCFECFS